LETLWLGGDLTTLPPEIGQLTHLKRLWIAGNNFVTLPPEIKELQAKGVDVIPKLR